MVVCDGSRHRQQLTCVIYSFAGSGRRRVESSQGRDTGELCGFVQQPDSQVGRHAQIREKSLRECRVHIQVRRRHVRVPAEPVDADKGRKGGEAEEHSPRESDLRCETHSGGQQQVVSERLGRRCGYRKLVKLFSNCELLQNSACSC